LSELDRRTLWVRAGGRCTLCKSYLLEGGLTAKEVPLGERAHVVGREDSDMSARGKHPMPVEDRDDADNLMLACSSCHTEIDKRKVAGTLDVALLDKLKREHEAAIRTATGLLRTRRTAIVRMAGAVRGGTMQLPRSAAAEAVIACATRFPFFVDSFDRQGVEIDLLNIDGEDPLDETYYPAAIRRIDNALNNQVLPGVESGTIDHLSVFAIARVPLLVYLGAQLDDGIPTDIYQRHRSTDSWQWPKSLATTGFDLAGPAPDDGGTDAVLVTNLSGATPLTDLPEDLQGAPTWVITPDTGQSEDVFASAEILARFVETVRTFFTALEATHKQVQAEHLFGALPLSGAVALGRVLKSRGIRPVVVTYDRDGDRYNWAVEI
jgi:hypothetical protein